MENITEILGAAPGIQWQGEKDNSQTPSTNAMNVGIVVGRFKRGRTDKPFLVSASTIQKRLGYDPTNFDYMAVQDVLDLGVPSVWVQRVRAGVAETNVESGILDNYNPIEQHILVAESGVITLSTEADLTNKILKITFALRDILDDGCHLDVQFFSRSGAALTNGIPTSISDITAILTFKDRDTGEKLYTLSGLLAANGSIISLADAATDSEVFSSFTVSVVGENTDADAAGVAISSDAGNLPNTLGRNKVTLVVGAMAGANASVPASFYTQLTNTLIYGTLRPNYLALPLTDDLSLITALLLVVKKRNCILFGDIDPSLSLDSASVVSSGIEAKDYRVRWYWNTTKSRPRDATTIRGGKVFRPCIGVMLGYTLLRNANTNTAGIPPLDNPIAGYDFPLPFKGLEARDDIFFNQDTLDRLAALDVCINPVILHQGEDGARFIFGDLKTQYDDDNSALTIANSAEIAVYTNNIVIDIASRYLRKGTDTFIEFADRDCRERLDDCVTAGLLKPAENLGGKPYRLSITPREDRPFDAVDIHFAKRPVGAIRAAILNTSIEK
jgi:hypothetical protein